MQVIAFAPLLAALLHPQDAARPMREESTPPGIGRLFFREGGVDFWGERKAAAARKAAEPRPVQESIWAEPQKLPDGRMTVYVPPRAVLGFLENPTRESAKEYLAWQEERAKKLKAAMEIIRDLREERTQSARPAPAAEMSDPLARPVLPPSSLRPLPAAPEGEILYFKRKDCPWCAKEDEVVAWLARTRPEIKVRTLQLEETPELAQEYGVTVVPTLVVPAPRGRKVVLRGFIPAAQLIRVIEEVNRAEK